MSLIPAIVLTYDRNRPFLEHMIRCYQELWPSHPLVFHVPFQELSECTSPQTTMVPAPKGIRDSVLTLLSEFEDHQWIYWCIDDKYPTGADISRLERLVAFVGSEGSDGIDGICACRTRALLTRQALRTNRYGLYYSRVLPGIGPLFQRRNYRQIWLHQFLRVGVLRRLFESFPKEVVRAKELDYVKDRISLPDEHKLYVTRGCHISFGESAFRGTVTRNCLESMRALGIKPPTAPGYSKLSIEIGSLGMNSWWTSPIRCIRDVLSTKFAG